MNIGALLIAVFIGILLNIVMLVFPRLGYIESDTADRIYQMLILIGVLTIIIGE
jgi:hypothetical protein